MKAYLFPRFEGQDRKHESLVSEISQALNLEGSDVDNINAFLAVWTGFELSG